MRYLLRHLRRKLPHLREALNRHHLVLLAEIIQDQRGAPWIEMRQHEGNRRRMFTVEQFAQLRRISALELGEVSLRGLLGTAQQREQILGSLLAKGLGQQAPGIIEATVNHEILRLQKLPELF